MHLSTKYLAVAGMFLAAAAVGLLKNTDTPGADLHSDTALHPAPQSISIDTPDVLGVDTFSHDEFRTTIQETVLPGLIYLRLPPPITNNSDTDERIIRAAKTRGYRLQGVANSLLDSVDNEFLHPDAAQAWTLMKESALRENVELVLKSGYRSVEQQRELFLGRLSSIVGSVTNTSFPDWAIDAVLATASPPGFSRHHSGFTIDIADQSQPNFDLSAGYEWMSANNFESAKMFGFMPSYPTDTAAQGPNPESWEFVWVGKNATFSRPNRSDEVIRHD